MNWNNVFEYKNGQLYWKIKQKYNIDIGTKAGCKTEGYIKCKYKQKQIFAHRIIWEIHFGKIKKGFFIDHIDGNGLNNKIENLRLVTPEENTRNLSLQKRNKSGFNGIRWDSSRNKWFVYITLKNKMYNLGRYKTKEEAILVRKKAEKINGFHPNHGRTAFSAHTQHL